MKKQNSHFRKLAVGVAAASLSCLLAAPAMANSITLGDLGAPVANGPDWDFAYDYTFANSEIRSGDYFTINDFGPATVQTAPDFPLGFWSFSQALSGPNSIPATDDPTILNATFTWTGPTVNLGAGSSVDQFVLTSPFGPGTKLVEYTSIDHIATGNSAGQISRVIGSVNGPVARQVPDKGMTALLLGVGVLTLQGFRRKLVLN